MEDVIGNKDKTVEPFAGLLNIENHCYRNCNIFQKTNFLVHAHNSVKLQHSKSYINLLYQKESIIRALGLAHS